MQRQLNRSSQFAYFRMSSCSGLNFSTEDLYYLNKTHPDNKSWAWWLNNLGTLFIFFIGFFGNILCLLVLCRRRLRRNSYTQYLIALAIVDTGAIFAEAISAIDALHQVKYKSSLVEHNRYSCKFYNYIRYIFYSMSSWIIVSLAVERLVAIKFPLWSKYICTVVNARRIIVLTLLFTMTIQSYHFLTKGLDCSTSNITNQTNCRCKTVPHPTFSRLDFILTVYVWRITLMTLLPLTIIITANILIMNKLFQESSLVDHTSTTCNAQRKMKLVYKISRMLVIVTSIYLLLHVPGSILEILKYMSATILHICSIKWRYYLQLSHSIFDLLTNLNYCINFYLYIISGKHIRNELIRAFKHVSLRSKTSVQNGKSRRSSYYVSSYMHLSKYNQPRCSITPLSRRATGSSIQRLSSC